MHRTSSIIAMLSLLLPTVTPASQQHPGDPSRPHPAIGAHAHASAAISAARRMQTCGQLAGKFLDLLLQGHYAAARQHLSKHMQAALDSAGLGNSWRTFTTNLGPLQARGPMQTLMLQSIPVAITPLTFAHGKLSAQWTCAAGKLTSFQLQALTATAPLPAPKSPSTS